jgi:hypothetical protein
VLLAAMMRSHSEELHTPTLPSSFFGNIFPWPTSAAASAPPSPPPPPPSALAASTAPITPVAAPSSNNVGALMQSIPGEMKLRLWIGAHLPRSSSTSSHLCIFTIHVSYFNLTFLGPPHGRDKSSRSGLQGGLRTVPLMSMPLPVRFSDYYQP